MCGTQQLASRITATDQLPYCNVAIRVSQQADSWRVTGLEHEVSIRLGMRPDSSLVCTELRVHGESITARWLRHEFRLGEIVDQIAIVLGAKARRGAKLRNIGVGWFGEPDQLRELLDRQPRQPRQAKVDEALLTELATKYRELVRSGVGHPVKALASRHRWSNGRFYGAANIRRLLRLARDRGLLGPAIHGKAGERSKEKSRQRTKRPGGKRL